MGEGGHDGCPGFDAPRVLSLLLAKKEPPKWKTGSSKDAIQRLKGGQT